MTTITCPFACCGVPLTSGRPCPGTLEEIGPATLDQAHGLLLAVRYVREGCPREVVVTRWAKERA